MRLMTRIYLEASKSLAQVTDEAVFFTHPPKKNKTKKFFTIVQRTRWDYFRDLCGLPRKKSKVSFF